MQLPEVKRLASTHSEAELRTAETALLDEQPLPFEVNGTDEGEQLTHVLGALDVLGRVAAGEPFNQAFRAFAQRVRDSIS